MLIKNSVQDSRESKLVDLNADFIIAGGGMAGTCSAITAARQGLKVVLVQDRPVLGGNASSEVRLWILGASSHMGTRIQMCQCQFREVEIAFLHWIRPCFYH